MELRWTVVDAAARGATTQVRVRCPRGTRLHSVLPLPPDRPPGRPRSHPVDTGWVSAGGQVLDGDAVVGLPPLLDGAVLTVGAAGVPPPRTVPTHLLEVAVTCGPAAGTVVPLHRSRTAVGRAAGSDIRLDDPRLSRQHCTVVVSTDGLRVLDGGSTNGTGPDPELPVRLGEEWLAGCGLLQVRATTREPLPPVTVEDRGDGTRELRRPPRSRVPERPAEWTLPAPARPGRSSTFPLLAVVLPALAGAGLAWWTGSVVYLVLAALGPLLVAGSWWSSRREARREGRLGRRAHARACQTVRSDALSAATALAAARRSAMPDAVTVLESCTGVAGHLWERHHTDDDALRVRLGRASPGPAASVGGGDDLVARVHVVDHDGRREPVRTVDDLLSLDLRAGPVGVVEPGRDPSCARFVVGQLVALLPPSSLGVVPVLGGAAREAWAWLHLLPHVDLPHVDEASTTDVRPARAVRDVLGLVASRTARRTVDQGGRATGGAQDPAPPVLVVVDDVDEEVDAADLQRLSGAHLVGVHVLVVARATSRLPRLCSVVVAPASADGVEGRVARVADGVCDHAVLDRVAPWWSARLSRALAPLRMATRDQAAAVPRSVPLGDLLDLRPGAVAHRWGTPDDGLPAPLGVGPDGPVVVDLTTAGPHALVAGTTGTGKSELLRSWLLALAAGQPPDRLALLLVDYKGGATFDDLTPLPHCIGMLTDLDGGATARVLHSLRAEVRRRESVLAAAGARDLAGYRSAPGAREPLPRLLVVVDEFRVLADDAPDVLGQFVRLAATGRSLGIHLVLATQRPGGVVSTDIRANTGLRVALRVQDAAESRDVVDRPDAAWLPPSAPGRAVLVGAGVDVVLQTAWTGGEPTDHGISVTAAGRSGRVPARTPDGVVTGDGRTTTVADRGATGVVDAIVEAARLTGASPARAPWLPPLPGRIRRLEDGLPTGPGPARGASGARPHGLVLGVADLPWSQSRRALAWSPLHDGPLLVLGATRSGRSTTLSTIAHAARRAGVLVAHLVAGAGTEDHLVDVLTALLAGPPPEEAPRSSGTGSDEPEPCRLLLVIDDVDELLDPGADPAATDLLLRLARSGHRGGVGVALAGGRTLASSRLAAAARCRLVHGTVDRSDAVAAGVPARSAVLPPVPGRCHAVGFDHLRAAWADHGADTSSGAAGTPLALEVQVLLPPDGTAHLPRGRAADEPDGHPGGHPGGHPDGHPGIDGAGRLDADHDGRLPPAASLPGWVPRALPRTLSVASLPVPCETALPLGCTGDAVPWLLLPRDDRLVVVAGPAGSGRTTTLRTTSLQASAAGLHAGAWPPRATGAPPGPPLDLLLVDDVDLVAGAELLALEQWLTAGSGPLTGLLHPRATLVVAGSTSWFADGFRGVPALARQGGRGVVLSPARTDVRDVLGVRGGPPQLERHPGRGLLVERGRVRRVQVARHDLR